MSGQSDDRTSKDDCYETAHDVSIVAGGTTVGAAGYASGGIGLLEGAAIFATTQSVTNEGGQFLCDHPIPLYDTDGAYALAKLGIVDPDSSVGREFLDGEHQQEPAPATSLDSVEGQGFPAASFDGSLAGLHPNALMGQDVQMGLGGFDNHLSLPDPFAPVEHATWDEVTLASGVVVHVNPTDVTDPVWAGVDPELGAWGNDLSSGGMHQSPWNLDEHTGSSASDGLTTPAPDPFVAAASHWGAGFDSSASHPASFDSGGSHDAGASVDTGGSDGSVAD